MEHFNVLWCWLLFFSLLNSAELVRGQEESVCYGPGSIAASVILTSIFTVLLSCALFLLWKRYRRKQREHLILESSDTEKGKTEYAFDNPGFKDSSLTPAHKLENTHKKWTQWPLAVLTTKSEKKKTLDDSAIDMNEVKVVALRSHDFTGLGFNICGNMKEGIFIKDVLHRGPASESGKLNTGDRINSLTISFEHMVYEDALTILSYASPYEVIIEAKGGKVIQQYSNGQGAHPTHPVYRSSSCTDLLHTEKSTKRRLFGEECNNSSMSSNYSSLQKSRSNMTTLERKDSQSPTKIRPKKPAPKAQLSPSQLKNQLEERILADHENHLRIKEKQQTSETQKTEGNKFQKFGIRVLPEQQKSPKIAEQNENNVNIEKNYGIDEVDKNAVPQAKKREKKTSENNEFVRDNNSNSSGIKRDKNGIPQEIPNYMLNAAVAARSNRKNSEDNKGSGMSTIKDETPKKKGKAPAPPPTEQTTQIKNNLDEIQLVSDEILDFTPREEERSLQEEIEVELRSKENNQLKDYNSDSDLEADNQSSVNTIELNSSDITIHHAEAENDEKQNRRTASTGDLTKMQKNRSNTNTLERAQSLDITDTSIPCLTKKRKGTRIEDEMKSDEDLFGKAMINKEPRLSLILDGLNTFQRNRLKKSTEWGNLEDAILKLNQENEYNNEEGNFCAKSKEFDAFVDKINEIKNESFEEIIEPSVMLEKKVKNQIWPIGNDSRNINDSKDIQEKSEIDKKQIDLDESELKSDSNLNESRLEIDGDNKETDDLVIGKMEERYEKRQQKSLKYEQVPPPTDDDDDDDELPEYRSVIEQAAVSEIDNNNYFINIMEITRDFIFTEKLYCEASDTNISDDIKVSRHSLGSLERAKSDDVKSMINNNISNVTVNEYISNLEEDLYTTALDNTTLDESSKVTVSTPINESMDYTIQAGQGPTSLTLEIPSDIVKHQVTNTNEDSPKSTSLTYITEIQVATPSSNHRNISEIEIIPNTNGRNLDSDFENYVKHFDSIKYDDKNELSSLIINDAEKELNKIQEIAEEQLKKLPEMRFTTSSYETPSVSSKIPEKRQNQIEVLRSNFEKNSNNKTQKTEVKSRIPIATITKTPPTSPERRDSRNLDMENDQKAILELMSCSTPKYHPNQMKPSATSKNVTVTSIRTNSKIPSGLPVLSGSTRPPIPPRRQDSEEQVVQLSTPNGVENSFKQWVFNPSENSITNITVTEGKTQK